MPRISISEDTIPESILLDDGQVTTIMLDIKYSPYEKQIPKIENICGSFREAVPSQGLEGVLIKTKNSIRDTTRNLSYRREYHPKSVESLFYGSP